MGMAASQARLLTLTARMHDVEYKAQNLQSQKLALATQRDELYQNYCDALEATEYKVAFINNGKEVMMDANYSTLCTFNEKRKADYALVDNNNGKIIVTEDIKRAYDSYGYTDKFAFAWAAMGYADDLTYDDHARGNILTQLGVGNAGTGCGVEMCIDSSGQNAYMTDVEYAVYNNVKGNYSDLDSSYNGLMAATDPKEQRELLKEFRELLYSKCGNEIWQGVNTNKNYGGEDIVLNQPNVEWNDIEAEFKYYTRIWEAINEAGGCTTIDGHCQSGEEGNQWFYNMVKAGQVGIMYLEKNDDTTWDETSIATSVNDSYLQETEADEKKLKKAEAEYEHGLDIINRKDTKFDTELSKLETERTAIKTEMDSIKQVRDDNIERTFGIFS